jgi:hypothetical protein
MLCEWQWQLFLIRDAFRPAKAILTKKNILISSQNALDGRNSMSKAVSIVFSLAWWHVRIWWWIYEESQIWTQDDARFYTTNDFVDNRLHFHIKRQSSRWMSLHTVEIVRNWKPFFFVHWFKQEKDKCIACGPILIMTIVWRRRNGCFVLSIAVTADQVE